VTGAEVVLALVTAQRGAELLLSRRNTQRLMASGAVEAAPGHYPLLVAVHASWLIALWVFGHNQTVNPLALAAYLALQGLRAWVMLTLGARWTTGIIVLPHEPLIVRGPYRFLRHPNYVVVAGEIAVLPLMLGLFWIAAIFTVLNAAVLFIRIRAENQALDTLQKIA
jgi:methyltransferase